MCVLSREDSHPSNTNVVMHRLGNGNILVCYLNSLAIEEPTLLMFPINGKAVNVWELEPKEMMLVDDQVEELVDKHTLFNWNTFADVTDGCDVSDGTFETENYKGQVVKLDENFYKSVDSIYYKDIHTFKRLTKSLVETKTDVRDDLFAVLAQAKESMKRGNICVEYQFPVSGKLIIAGTLHEDRRVGHVYNKGDFNVVFSPDILEHLKGDLGSQLLEYVRREEGIKDGYTLVTRDCGGQEKNEATRCSAIVKEFEDRTKTLHFCIRCPLQIIRVGKEFRLKMGVNFKGCTILSFGDFRARKNNNLILC